MSRVLRNPACTGETRIESYVKWLGDTRSLQFQSYEDLWRWSVTELDSFWLSIWNFFGVRSDAEPAVALAVDAMPGAMWFPEVAVNYAEMILEAPGRADDEIVVVGRSHARPEVTLTAQQLRDQVARARAGLLRLGVQTGDRVAAYAPNIPETLVLFLAAASLGAIFSSCSPELGAVSVADRWRQIDPTVILAVDGYRYGAKEFDRRREMESILADLPGSPTVVWLRFLDADAKPPRAGVLWEELLVDSSPITYNRVPFDTPLCILFSSGTTGPPKPIVHGHGGIIVEHLKTLGLHCDLGPQDRFFWFTTTSWVMWNLAVSALMVGSTLVLFDGDPFAPDGGTLWQMAAELDLTFFGAGAQFFLQCRREGLDPRVTFSIETLRGVGSTGAPLPPEGFTWIYEHVGEDVFLTSISGGTDVATAFVGGVPILPVYDGDIPARFLGVALQACDATGAPVVGEVGELVIDRPMPSMPVGFWNDDGSRYRTAYFTEFEGRWRHGDWIVLNPDGTCRITGRSDATLNRGGVRLGTAEFYRVVEEIPQISDSLVVHLEGEVGGSGQLLLFVVATADVPENELHDLIRADLRRHLSPRHVPDAIIQVTELPRTLTGKRLEIPVKRILQGEPVDAVVARGALANPDSLDVFAGLGRDEIPVPHHSR